MAGEEGAVGAGLCVAAVGQAWHLGGASGGRRGLRPRFSGRARWHQTAKAEGVAKVTAVSWRPQKIKGWDEINFSHILYLSQYI